jgi:hypothetical protein
MTSRVMRVTDERRTALETLRRIRDEQYPQISDTLLASVFDIELEAQFQSDRAPAIARLRDLILPDET